MGYSRLKKLLEKCVADGKCDFLTYSEFGQRFQLGNFPPAWANRRTLDIASKECKSDEGLHNLDLTFLIRSSSTHYPSVIDGRPFDRENPEPQILRAREEAQKIIKRFSPGTRNPY